ncbi:MAG: GGDEF domain-containing protein [Proteobacteria bacterium]|nr:GGDEF domain-containing protein [Alphaproteobacteria bacterium]NCC02438.1 GGDEF domain-containing protein [Pseudomonadota bacterium]
MTEASSQQTPELWAKQAMELLDKQELPPTPDNFAVFYAYASNSNPNLRMSLETLFQRGEILRQEEVTGLFLTHLSLEAENRILKETTDTIQNEINSVMGALTQTVGETKEYGKTLSTFSGSLEGNVSLDQIRAAVAKVANETRIMAEQNQRLHSQLSLSTQELTEMRYNLDEVRKATLIDPLTNVGNRMYFDTEMVKATAEAVDNDFPLSMLMCDIDFFKKFNDTYGHLVGDEVLKLVAKTLVENLKGRDIIARYGGEEFVILLPQTTLLDAERVGNQLRNTLSTKQVRRRRTNETLGIVTISLGATQYIPGEETDAFIDRADKALYEAKQTGRNKVVGKTST